MPDEVPQWLLEDLRKLDGKITKTNDQLDTAISLMSDLRVKVATLQSEISVLTKHSDDIDELKRQAAKNASDLALQQVCIKNLEDTQKDLKGEQAEIKNKLDTSRISEVKLDTKLTVYVGIISVIGAGVVSAIFSLLTNFLGGG